MLGYTYAADVYCKPCGDKIRASLDASGRTPANVQDETTFDSGEYPKGPVDFAYEEADYPDVCATCGVAMENPLTEYGTEQLLAAAQPT